MAIDGATRMFGLLGQPVDHSLSPAIHNFLFRRFGLNAVYVALPLSGRWVELMLRALRRTTCDGLNVTTPHKERVLAHLSGVNRSARLAGAANTLVRRPRGWYGLNTDGPGLCDFLETEAGVELKSKNVVVLGAGAAARAVLGSLRSRRVTSLTIINRSSRRLRTEFFRSLARHQGVGLMTADDSEVASVLSEAHVIVNATSWGLGGRRQGRHPWALESIERAVAVDLNYTNVKGRKTPFLQRLPQRITCYDGKGTLRWQAVHAFAAWTGQELAPVDHRALARHLSSLDILS